MYYTDKESCHRLSETPPILCMKYGSYSTFMPIITKVFTEIYLFICKLYFSLVVYRNEDLSFRAA